VTNELISTVLAPTVNVNLTDLATVKTELGITDTNSDAFLTAAITQVSRAVANYCNRVFQVELLSDLVYLDRWAPGSTSLQFARFPSHPYCR
jgi:hypothetical protein